MPLEDFMFLTNPHGGGYWAYNDGGTRVDSGSGGSRTVVPDKGDPFDVVIVNRAETGGFWTWIANYGQNPIPSPSKTPTPPPSQQNPAPQQTAQQGQLSQACLDALAVAGFKKPQEAQDAINRAKAAWDILTRAGGAHSIDPRILAALGIRETGFRNITGDHGHGHGIFQFDDHSYPDARNWAYDPGTAADRASAKVAGLIQSFTKFGPELAVAGALRGYNAGHVRATGRMLGRIANGQAGVNILDRGTAPGNPTYVTDVLAIAKNCF
ncbi:MAG: hypothetical protein AUG51_19715 [Acidobacteria bacterium 13_1_20CM_3_53_8]|nr:MAG: hypothetical protein AUG51_19715 [Acidobacteria bacterium 13_1_20CM_3_53_8]